MGSTSVSGRLYPAQGPLQGHHHFRRREYLVDRGRGRAVQASGGVGRRGGRQARRQMGRNALRLRRVEIRRASRRRRTAAMVQEASRRLQGAALFRVRGYPEDEYGEDSEVQAAGDGEGSVSSPTHGSGQRHSTTK